MSSVHHSVKTILGSAWSSLLLPVSKFAFAFTIQVGSYLPLVVSRASTPAAI